MTPEQQREWQEWLESRPPAVRAVAEAYPPDCCYRLRDAPGHYWLYSYGEDDNPGGAVTVTLLHGRDSVLPGVGVFGIDPAKLVRCGCGNWEWPTEGQVKATARRVDALGAAVRAWRHEA